MKRTSFFILLLVSLLSTLGFAEEPLAVREGYIESDGAKIYYKRMGAGDPIIMLHGGPGLDHTFFLPQATALAKNHELIFYDQRGSGNSAENFDVEKINLSQFVLDLENLRRELALDSPTLLGYSWGGIVASKYAAKYPNKLSSLILLNPCPITEQGLAASYEELKSRSKKSGSLAHDIKESEAFMAGDLPTIKNFYHELFKGYFYDPSAVYNMELNLTRETPILHYTVFSLFEENLLTNFDLSPELTHIKAPTFVIYGEHDFIPTWIPREIASKIPGAECKEIKECGHFSYIEKPKEFFETVESFLEK